MIKTNEEALQITGLLVKSGMQAKLIQSNDGFNMYDLLEIRFFLSQHNLSEDIYVINEDIWENAKRKLSERFGKSLNREMCTQLNSGDELTIDRDCCRNSKGQAVLKFSRMHIFSLFGQPTKTSLN